MSLKTFTEVLNGDHELAIRLAFIDFKSFYTGSLSRTDLVNEFSVSEITATRILSEYKKVRPKNITYSNKEKKFLLEKSFVPLIDIHAEDALSMLATGFDKNKLLRGRKIIRYERIGLHQPLLNRDSIATITRSIYNKKNIKCRYYSAANADKSERVLSPLVIMFDGRNWIFRAHHENSNTLIKFKNFNFSRVIDVTETECDIDREHSLEYDELWSKFLPLELEINASLNETLKNEVRRDFSIPDEENKVLLTERAAFIWIILNQWAVSYCDNNITSAKFILKNADMLKNQGAI